MRSCCMRVTQIGNQGIKAQVIHAHAVRGHDMRRVAQYEDKVSDTDLGPTAQTTSVPGPTGPDRVPAFAGRWLKIRLFCFS